MTALVMMNKIDTFETYRSKLFGLAYRITGSVVEAEDITQEAFIKWDNVEQNTIQSPYAWLMTVVSRMSLDQLKRARSQRQAYIGPWLPEPYIADNEIPENELELDETITMALLVLLEQLTPAERAAFILHDLFHFNHEEVGAILGKSGTSCRQLCSRARKKINKNVSYQKIRKEEHKEMVSAFFNAVKNGEMENLVSLLQENVILHADGGGKAAAAREILRGVDVVMAFLQEKVAPSFLAVDTGETLMTPAWFNGSSGFVIWQNAKPITAFNFEIENHRINKIHALRNPDKLGLFEMNR